MVPVQTSIPNAPLTFPLVDDALSLLLDVQAQVLHHALDEVVQSQAAALGRDGLSADGTLLLLFAPLVDAVGAEAVGAVQGDRLQKHIRHLNGSHFQVNLTTELTSMKSSEQMMH